MKYIFLFLALLSTLIWVNITVAEIANGGSVYKTTLEDEKKRASAKTVLAVLISLFWTLFFS